MFWLGLILPVCFVPGYTGATIPTQWVLLSAILPAATLWRAAPRLPLQTFLGLVFLGWTMLTLLWAPNYRTSVLGLWYVAIWALSYRLGTQTESLVPLWKGLALGLTLSTVVAIGQALGFNYVETNSNEWAGLLFNSTVAGLACAIVLIALCANRLWLYIPGPAIGLALAGSRGAYFVLGLTALLRLAGWRWTLGCLFLGAAAFTDWLAPSDSWRLTIWGHALRNMSFLGWGPFAFNDIYYIFGRSIIHPEYIHNDYLQLWFEFGPGSLALFALGWLALGQDRSPNWYPAVAIAICATFYFPLYCPLLAFMACVLAGNLNRDYAWACPQRPGWGHDLLSWTPHSRSIMD